ncbi:putative F-box domain, galactose oxidase/kelch, beta-propeller, F-box associated interaction [Dioscorea sansibarensis]
MSHTTKNFTDDLLINILSRLPTKSLCRFLCVSKAWHNLISDGYFQARRPPTMTGLLYHYRDQSWNINIGYISVPSYKHGFIDTALSFLPYPGNIRILDSCNGLLLCHFWETPYSISSNVCVCNPTAQSWTLLPNLKLSTYNSLYLAFDPKVSPYFTLVLLQCKQESLCVEVDKFSSQTNSWTKILVSTKDNIQTYLYRIVHMDGCRKLCRVFLNGIIYMVAGTKHMVCIDPENMVCDKVIEMPEAKSMMMKEVIGKSQGSLHLALKEKQGIKIWMLKDCEKSEWVLKHSFGLEVVFDHFLACHPDMDIIFLRMKDKIMSCKMNNGELKEVCELSQRTIQWVSVFSPFFGQDALENKN